MHNFCLPRLWLLTAAAAADYHMAATEQHTTTKQAEAACP